MVFYQENAIHRLELGCTLPNLANISLHKSTDAQFCSFMKGDKDIFEKLEKLLLLVHLSFLHAKQLLMKLLFESLQTYANALLGLMPAISIPIRCVNPCLPFFIRFGISIQRLVDLRLGKTRPAALKIWSCPFSTNRNRLLKSRAFIQQPDRRKLTASVLMVFVLILPLCSMQWTAFTTSVVVKKFVRFSQRRIFNVVVWRESSMNWDEAIYAKKASLSLNRGSLIGVDYTRQAFLSTKHIRENFPYGSSFAVGRLLGEIKTESFCLPSVWHWNTSK